MEQTKLSTQDTFTVFQKFPKSPKTSSSPIQLGPKSSNNSKCITSSSSVPRRRAERKDRPACRVPFLSDRPSNPHKEMQKKVLCGLFFPFVFLRGAVRKVSRLLSWAWVEGNLRRMGYRTGLCCFSPVLPYIYLWWPEKCMTTPHFEEGSGN